MVIYSSDLTEGKVATASSTFSIYGPQRAIDDNAGTNWHPLPPAAGSWVQVDLIDSHIVIKLTIQNRGTYNQGIEDFILKGSNNSEGPWTNVLIDTVLPIDHDVHDFEFVNVNSFRYWRLTCVSAYVWDDMSISEIELMEEQLPTYNISGNVKDSDGNNLNDVTIILENTTDYETSTGVDGNYLQIVDPDIYTVTASKTGYIPSSAVVDASTEDKVQNFILNKPIISGNVKNSDGNNLVGVLITLENDTDYETSTGAAGNYSEEVNTDIYSVTASKSGYLSSTIEVDASTDDQVQDFILSMPVIPGYEEDFVLGKDTAPHNKGIILKSKELLESNI